MYKGFGAEPIFDIEAEISDCIVKLNLFRKGWLDLLHEHVELRGHSRITKEPFLFAKIAYQSMPKTTSLLTLYDKS